MSPRFQADNDLRKAIRLGLLLKEPSIDFESALREGLDGVPDPEVLRIAADAGRILVSHDTNTMPRHFRAYLAIGKPSPGVIIVPQNLSTGTVIERLLLVWIASDAEEWRNRLTWLP